METSPPESSRLELFDAARSISPPLLKRILPLRIVKRSDSDLGDPDADIYDLARRNCSKETDESRGSVPEPPGGQRQLTIPKVRGHTNSQRFGSLDEVDESPVPLGRKAYRSQAPRYASYNGRSVPRTSFLPLDLPYNPSNRDDHNDSDSFRSRHSPTLRDKAYTKSDIGFRDHFAFLTSKRTMPTAYRPFPGLMNFIHGPETTKYSAECDLSPLTPFGEFDAPDDPFSSAMRMDDQGPPPITPILVPIVCITPDTRVIDMGYHNFWVAVEVTAGLYRPGGEPGKQSQGITSRSRTSTRSEELDTTIHGFLYDLQVDVESTYNSRVLEVVEHEVSPKVFTSGSRALVLVNIELDLTNFSRLRGHIRSRSDELMEDLETQLGSGQCEYLTVNLVYRHSVFSAATALPGSVSPSNGIARAETKICTAFTATINRYNASSPWSPPPAPTPNCLVGIIAAH